MMRKLLLVAVAAAAPIGLIAIAGTAGRQVRPAGTPRTRSPAQSLKGTVTFSPPVTSSEAAGSGSTALNVKFSKCTSNAAGLSR